MYHCRQKTQILCGSLRNRYLAFHGTTCARRPARQVSPDLQGFALIWREMVAYTETLPAWPPGEGNYWNRAEPLAGDLMGLSQSGIAVLGDAKYKSLISSFSATDYPTART